MESASKETSSSPSSPTSQSRQRSGSQISGATGGSGGSSQSKSKSKSKGKSKASTAQAASSSSSSSSSSPLGPFLTSLAVPQGWFLHFYALGSVAAAAVLGAALRGGGSLSKSSSSSPSSLPPSSVAALVLLLVHVLRRWAECSWQASWPREAKMHAIAYAFGMSYYAVLPLSLLPAGAFGATAAAVRRGEAKEESRAGGVGGFVGAFLSKLGGAAPSSSSAPSTSLQHPASLVVSAFSSLSPPRLLGVAVFAAGTLLQAASHAALASLQEKAAASRKQYLSPDASGSRVLSLCACPHYLGEIVIYLGLALVAAGGVSSSSASSFPFSSILTNELSSGILPLLVLVWVSVNLVLASGENKRWYRKNFPGEFPETRAALVPGVF